MEGESLIGLLNDRILSYLVLKISHHFSNLAGGLGIGGRYFYLNTFR
jgi:hypothetical protein